MRTSWLVAGYVPSFQEVPISDFRPLIAGNGWRSPLVWTTTETNHSESETTEHPFSTALGFEDVDGKENEWKKNILPHVRLWILIRIVDLPSLRN